MKQHPLREVAQFVLAQHLEHQRDGQIIEQTVLEVAKRKCCKTSNNTACLDCLQDCPFAGDKNYEHVIENAHKVVTALAMGVFDGDNDVLALSQRVVEQPDNDVITSKNLQHDINPT